MSLERELGIQVNRLGDRAPLRWVHAALGIPAAGEGQAVVGQLKAKRE